MPSSAGPNIAGESNLVFAYDLGDTVNSFKGEPSTNLALFSMNGGFSSDYPSNITFIDDSTVTYQGRQSKRVVATGQWNIYKYPRSGNYTATSSGQFTYSFKIKWADGHTPYFSNGYIYVDASTTYPGITVRAIDNGWFWCYCTYSGTSSPPWLTGFTTTDTGACWIVDWQLEAGLLHPTQYIAPGGTRSATQGLVSLATPSTIDLTDVSFDSTAQMIFDGTNDKIYGIDSIVSYLSSSAIEFIVTPTTINKRMTVGGYRQNDGYSQPTIGMVYIQDDNTFNASVITTTQVYRAVTSTTTITANKTYHVVFNKDTSAGLMQLYVNGVLESTQTFDPNTYAQWATTGSYIGSNLLDLGKSNNTNAGQGWSSDFLAGKIPIFKLYSRTLLPSEVAQNYRAYKTRFNLA